MKNDYKLGLISNKYKHYLFNLIKMHDRKYRVEIYRDWQLIINRKYKFYCIAKNQYIKLINGIIRKDLSLYENIWKFKIINNKVIIKVLDIVDQKDYDVTRPFCHSWYSRKYPNNIVIQYFVLHDQKMMYCEDWSRCMRQSLIESSIDAGFRFILFFYIFRNLFYIYEVIWFKKRVYLQKIKNLWKQ